MVTVPLPNRFPDRVWLISVAGWQSGEILRLAGARQIPGPLVTAKPLVG